MTNHGVPDCFILAAIPTPWAWAGGREGGREGGRGDGMWMGDKIMWVSVRMTGLMSRACDGEGRRALRSR